jgi:hypothetical protein
VEARTLPCSLTYRVEVGRSRSINEGGVTGGPCTDGHARMTAWLDENCGTDGWAMTPSGTRGVLNDAVSTYFPDPALASAFVARWCIGYKVESADGAFRVREDERHRGSGLGCTGTLNSLAGR